MVYTVQMGNDAGYNEGSRGAEEFLNLVGWWVNVRGRMSLARSCKRSGYYPTTLTSEMEQRSGFKLAILADRCGACGDGDGEVVSAITGLGTICGDSDGERERGFVCGLGQQRGCIHSPGYM